MTASTAAPALCLTRVRLIPGDGSEPIEDAMLCMEAGRVSIAAAMNEATPPPLAQVLELPGRSVLPGFVNAHMHDAHSPEARREQYLLQGVTTLCDLAAPVEAVPQLLRPCTARGQPAPRTITAGLALTAPGGYPANYHGGAQYTAFARSAAEAARVVGLLYAWGARVVKLMFEPGYPSQEQPPFPVLCLEAARGAVAKAHELGMAVRAHISEAGGLRRALDAGVDGVEHLPLRTSALEPACVAKPHGLAVAQEVQGLLRRMVRQGAVLVPTLDAVTRGLWDNAPAVELVRLFHQFGGRIAGGTDAPFAQVAPGLPLRELGLLHQAGLPPLACLQACSQNAALAAGLRGVGVLRPGWAADALVLQGDPLADFATLQQLEFVFLGGEQVLPPAPEQDGLALAPLPR